MNKQMNKTMKKKLALYSLSIWEAANDKKKKFASHM